MFPKTKPHIFVLLAFLIVLGMIVSPSMAYTITAEPLGGVLHPTLGKTTSMEVDMSPQGEAVQRILVDVPTGTSVNFTLWYGSGKTVTGWMQYTQSSSCDDFISFFDSYCQYSGVAIGSDAQGYNYRGVQEIGRMDIVGYGRNDTSNQTGFLVYDTVVGVWQGQIMSFYAVSNPQDMVIYKFQITSNNPVDITYYTNTRQNVLNAATKTIFDVGSEWVNFALSIGSTLLGFVLMSFAVIKFFFIDNFLLVIALWISVTMAYSAISTRNIFQFYTKFFRYQKSLYYFMIELWNYLIQIVSSFRGIFRI